MAGLAESLPGVAPDTASESEANPGDAPVPQSLPEAEVARTAICSALASAGHVSASQLLAAGAWELNASTLRIEVGGVGKKMLTLTVNVAAEKIIRQELQRLGASSRFILVAGAASSAPPSATPPVLGGVQEDALNHPMVQRAKEIFQAEVRSVLDLRVK
jgi:DNA polymerase III subunit gamma/tau